MYLLIILQVLIIILAVFTIVILIKKKWKQSVYLIIIILILFLVIFFSTSSKLGLNYIFGYEQAAIPYIPDKIEIDGKIAESCWDLQKKDMYLLKEWTKPGGKKKTSLVPSFQFLRDSSNIYFGFLFDTGIDTLSRIPPSKLHLSLRLRAFNSKLSHFRLAFAPFNMLGNSTGYPFCDCSKCRVVSNYNFASHFNGGIWTFEFSIPFEEIMNPEDNFLMYKFTFVNKLIDEEVSSYPAPDENYKEYFVIN